VDWLWKLLAEVPYKSCEVYKIPKRAGHPRVPEFPGPGSTVYTYPAIGIFAWTVKQAWY